eukprot:TRINITY_DN714_c0_g1_i1.p1 TRINITY_DN714_c0_g1~~TRINITY_DN714_c0_g1_i1.p1  ORF type:complete len:138 (-),score=13.86 TRINITY_DN714_c0_g1_i1:406-819(-)
MTLLFFNICTVQFVMPNGTEIGKVETHKTMNERILKISQVLPTEMYWMFYDYGNMFRWKLTIEVIKPQDSLPAPRLCAGVGLSPLENHTSLEDYVGPSFSYLFFLYFTTQLDLSSFSFFSNQTPLWCLIIPTFFFSL